MERAGRSGQEGVVAQGEPPGEGTQAAAARPLLSSVRLRPNRLPPALLERGRLREAVRGWRDHRLTLITAPAGYGKSTLAASALREVQQGVEQGGEGAGRWAWLALVEDDDDAVRFVSALGAALAPHLTGAAEQVARVALGHADARHSLLLLLLALEALDGPLLIVLDDFHRVQSDAVRDLMILALEQGPENVHWMLTARHMAPLPLGRLRLLGEILEIDAEDLRLRRMEIVEYVRGAGLPEADDETTALLEEQTQGWIAGLQLALLSLQRGEQGQARDARVVLSHLRGDNVLLAEYLTGEVLAQLPAALRSFLLEVSIVERLHPELCAAVTGVAGSRALLEQAVERQLFLYKAEQHKGEQHKGEQHKGEQHKGEQQGEWHTFHQLFRELLLRRLRMEQEPAAIRALYRRAADWYLARDEVTEAIRALVAGDALHLAAEVVQSRAQQALLEHRPGEVRHWLQLLPAATLNERPSLLVSMGWAAFSTGNFPELLTGMAQLRATLATRTAIAQTIQDEAAALELLVRYLDGNHNDLRGAALEAAARCAPESHHARGWALLLSILSSGPYPPDFDPMGVAEDALVAFRAANYTRGELLVHAWQTNQYALLCNADAVMEGCRRGLELSARQLRPDPDDFTWFSINLGETLYRLDRIDEARAVFGTLLADAQRIHSAYIQMIALAFLDLCDLADGAGEVAARAEEEQLWTQFMGENGTFAPLGRIVLLQMAREVLLGNEASLQACIQRMSMTVDELNEDTPPTVALAVLRGNLLLAKAAPSSAAGAALSSAAGAALSSAAGAAQQGMQTLESFIKQYLSRDMLLYGLQMQILRVQHLQLTGQRDAARSLLRQLLHTIERTGYVRMILDEPAFAPLFSGIQTSFARTLAARMKRRPAAAHPAATHPAATHPAADHPAADHPAADHPAADHPAASRPVLSAQQMAVLRLLAQGLSMKEMAARLVISPSTLKWHLTRIYARLGVENRRQAITAAHNFNLLND